MFEQHPSARNVEGHERRWGITHDLQGDTGVVVEVIEQERYDMCRFHPELWNIRDLLFAALL
jgi:hypothetical protein